MARPVDGRIPLFVPVFLLAVSLAAEAQSVRGITFTYRTSSASSGMMGQGGMESRTVGTGSAAEGKSRILIDSATGPAQPFSPGDYLVTVAPDTVYLVRPSARTYTDMLDEATSLMGGAGPVAQMQMTVSNVTSTVEKVGKSDVIEGRETQLVRHTMTYTMGMMGQSMSATQTSEYWIATLPVTFIGGLVGRLPRAAPEGPMKEIVEKTTEAMKQLPPGVPIRTVQKTTVAAAGMSFETSGRSEMIGIKEAQVDASQFKLPPDYKKVGMRH